MTAIIETDGLGKPSSGPAKGQKQLTAVRATFVASASFHPLVGFGARSTCISPPAPKSSAASGCFVESSSYNKLACLSRHLAKR